MPKARKKHVQQATAARRKGAGRPPKGKRSSEPHQQRDEIDPRHPLHVVTRIVDGLESLRKTAFYRAVCDATAAVFRYGVAKAEKAWVEKVAADSAATTLGGATHIVDGGGVHRFERDPRTQVVNGERFEGGSCDRAPRARSTREAGATTLEKAHVAGFRIVQASIQRNHLHLLVEASNKDELAEGMQVFLSSMARRINRAVLCRSGNRRRGRVFADRYYPVPLTTPRQVRNCLAYVLNNWRRHGEDRDRAWNVDPFSSGIWFTGWAERANAPLLFTPPENYVWMMTWLPKTWLLREGWKRYPLISLREVPGPLEGAKRQPSRSSAASAVRSTDVLTR